jgi:hypothetical protein
MLSEVIKDLVFHAVVATTTEALRDDLMVRRRLPEKSQIAVHVCLTWTQRLCLSVRRKSKELSLPLFFFLSCDRSCVNTNESLY